MPGLRLLVLTTALLLAVMPHDALAQAGRVGGVTAPAAPAPVVAPPPPAPAPVVPAAPPAAPMVHSFTPPTAGHAFSPPAAGSLALPQSHPPNIGAIATPRLTPQVNVPAGTAHINSGLTARTSPALPTRSIASHPTGVTATPPPVSGHRLRQHRRQGINTEALWSNMGTCWVWLTRPGHRRVRLHRCS